MSREHAAALRASSLCRLLSAAEVDAISAIAEKHQVAAGKELFREGDPGDGVYLVVSGEIDVVKRTRAGERSLARLGAGGVLGEMSLLTADARSATCRALVETGVLRLPSARFRALLSRVCPPRSRWPPGSANCWRGASLPPTPRSLSLRKSSNRRATPRRR